ncbi:hypothetical protein ACTXT7_014263 [Hymenolepis weldensis]
MLGWYDHSVFYRFRARSSVLLFGCSVSFLPILCLIYYVHLFLYPLFLMTFGHPIADSYSCYCFLIILLYTIYWTRDVDTPYRGGRRSKLWRSIGLWKWIAQYFPARLVVSDELREWSNEQGQKDCENSDCIQLPSEFNYLLGYHPHGPFAMGALMAYGSESLRFSKIFPGITPYMATLNLHYNVPFYRDYAMACGSETLDKITSIFWFIVWLVYTAYWIISYNWPNKGGIHSLWFRKLFLWRWAAAYFPAKLVVSEEMKAWGRKFGRVVERNGQVSIYLPKKYNYLTGYHPHGPLSAGAMGTYGNDSLGFSRAFPGIRPHIATLNMQFNIPIYRDYCMLGGGVSVSRESLVYLLDKDISGKSGNLVAVSVGGATEALESRPGHYVLMLSRRRGFFRMALKTGAHLVPSIGFGETNMYDQVANPEGSTLRKVQEWFTKAFTLAPPLFYSTRVIPYRRPVTVVVGRPIVCERIPNPTDEQVDKLREQYKEELVQMFNRYRPLYDPTAEDIRFF